MSQLSASEFKWENVGSQTCLVEFVLAEMIIRLLYWTADVPLISQINRAVENPSLLSAADSFWGNGGAWTALKVSICWAAGSKLVHVWRNVDIITTNHLKPSATHPQSVVSSPSVT